MKSLKELNIYMKIIISPSKQMKEVNLDNIDIELTNPIYDDKSVYLSNLIKNIEKEKLCTIFKVSRNLCSTLYTMYQNRLTYKKYPAIYSYDGICYKYIDILSMNIYQLNYINNYTRIISSLYGILKPFDLINIYRLDFMPIFSDFEFKNLYTFWDNQIAQNLKNEDYIINLASKEFLKSITPFIDKNKIINIKFCMIQNNKLVEKSPYVKMCRGRMLNLMAINNIEDLSEIKNLNVLDYIYSDTYSTSNEYVYIKKP